VVTGPGDDSRPDGVDDDEPFGALSDDGVLSDEELAAFGDLDEQSPSTHNALPPKIEAWRRRSAAGAILTGFALGLQQALEPKRVEPSISVQTSGDPPTDLPVEADFEFRRPRNSVVNVRPWLLDSKRTEEPSEDDGDDEERS